ncbi:hypothetical protein BC831DRAFT_470558 [Entophlyctis helioformis]|nr:hypothetical protein BC831DRAFT_470558 [Entophlyctis helioformis]
MNGVDHVQVAKHGQAQRQHQQPRQRQQQLMYASPNEAVRLQAEEERHKRLERLKQVREQDKRLAEERRQRFKEQSGKEWTAALGKMEEEWQEARDERLGGLQNMMQHMSAQIGKAHSAAASETARKEIYVQELYQSIADAQQQEIERSGVAAMQGRIDHYNRIEPTLMRRALLRSVKTQEDFRTQLVVHQCRERLKNSVQTVEILSQPLTRINRLVLQHGQTRQMHPRDYERTAIHRDYVVVRCDQPVQPDHIPAQTVRENAEAVRRLRTQALATRQETLKVLDESAKTRHRKAVLDIHMAKKRETVIHELGQLDLDDRRRKQANAALYQHHFRPDFVRLAPGQLKTKFIHQFDLENNDQLAIQRDQSQRSHLRKQSHYSQAANNSIEIVRQPEANVELVRVQPRRRTPLASSQESLAQVGDARQGKHT